MSVGRCVLIAAITFGLGSALGFYGVGAGPLFWFVMALIAIVKFFVWDTVVVVRNRNSEWKETLLKQQQGSSMAAIESRMATARLPGDRNRLAPPPQTGRLSPPS